MANVFTPSPGEVYQQPDNVIHLKLTPAPAQSATPVSSGMSTGAVVAIVGVTAVVGAGVWYFWLRK
jgi:hypothetical protein